MTDLFANLTSTVAFCNGTLIILANDISLYRMIAMLSSKIHYQESSIFIAECIMT